MSRRPNGVHPVGAPVGGVPSLAGLTINVPKTTDVEGAGEKRVREDQTVEDAILSDPALKDDLKIMAEAMQLYFPSSGVVEADTIWKNMYELQNDLSDAPDTALLLQYRTVFQKVVFVTRRKPASMFRGLGDANPLYMMTSLMRSPLFAAMCQPEGPFVHTQVFEDLADTVRNGRKQFTKVMVACTASSSDDEDDPGNSTDRFEDLLFDGFMTKFSYFVETILFQNKTVSHIETKRSTNT